ncbi:hypothetical protein [Streptomyces sp. NPDC093149]
MAPYLLNRESIGVRFALPVIDRARTAAVPCDADRVGLDGAGA